MKKINILLSIVILYSFIANAYCKEIAISSSEAFKITRTGNEAERLLVYSLAKGVISHAYFIARIINNNDKQTQCVSKTPIMWSEYVFNNLKTSKKTDKIPFELALSAIIYKECFNE